jgi:putative acetyltransferase
MITRLYHKSDIPQISRLYFDTVHKINAKDYSPKQIHAWAPEVYPNNFWQTRFHKYLSVIVAESGHNITGFTELENNGHIDCFYVHAKYQSRGIGKALLHAIEKIAIENNIHCLYVEASITARPFFLSQGFHEREKAEKSYRGQLFTQYIMEKNID